MKLDEALEVMDDYLSPKPNGIYEPPSMHERSAMRQVARALRTSREQGKVVSMAVENANRLVENS